MNKLPGVFIFPPYPREIGTVIPNELKKKCFELSEITLSHGVSDSPLGLSLEVSRSLGVQSPKIAGFDGYSNKNEYSKKHIELSSENQRIFDSALKDGCGLVSLTPTEYKNIVVKSLYNWL